ncbi:hypothetical protein [Pseudohoeflea coraliihabitans]|uniref:Uncharacterized protein n=1 Tax=Pseudohoeflea coraliihabitans TaxID=2860393 RepID=A0ABS6WN40_9HYPH|nr:hypothetical protein [Pseudohoeflea sp. DP4N28-3]MBW3096494.1 hypothetical protein [Pseudohoeflea sp. DP4N28-3]
MIPFTISTLHTIELIGSYTARHLPSGLTTNQRSRRNRNTTRSPISPLCRKLLEEGYDPSEEVHIIRKALDRDGYIPVFKRDRTLQGWADLDCVESDRHSVTIVRHRPFPHAVNAKNSREAASEEDGPEANVHAAKTHRP